MEHIFLSKLDLHQQEKATQFLINQNASIEQYPGWYEANGNFLTLNYYFGIQNDQILSFCTILETINKKAVIDFGPSFTSPDQAIESINEIKEYYKKKRFNTIKIQLFIPAGTDSEYIEQKLYLHSQIKHYVNKNENWSTLEIDLSLSDEEIYSKFSKGHKSAIKKALKAGIRTVELKDESEVSKFIEIFIKMHKARSLPINENQTRTNYLKAYLFLHQKNIGSIIAVYNSDDTMVGGIFLIKQGNRVRYFKGAADPDIRDIPVLHCALFEGFKIAKKWGAEIFDLWGYCLLADEKDQRYNINIFKKGFGGKLKIYPKTIYISLNLVMFTIYKHVLPVFKQTISSIKLLLKSKH